MTDHDKREDDDDSQSGGLWATLFDAIAGFLIALGIFGS